MDYAKTPRWSVRLADNPAQKLYAVNAPCWFHRFMQRLVLGIIWERVN